MKESERKARREKLNSVSMHDHAIATEQFDIYVARRERGHKTYINLATTCDQFYRNMQWDPAIKAEVEDAGRPALTLNIMFPTINAIHAESIKRRVDFRFKPNKPQYEDAAYAMTKLFKLELSRNHYNWIESQVVLDGLIQSRGYFDVRMNFEDNINGELSITTRDPLEVIPDPDAKEYDPNTWKDVITTTWLSLEDIEAMYGKNKADQLKYLIASGGIFMMDSIDFDDPPSNIFGGDESMRYTRDVMESERRTIRSARVIERQHRKMRRIPTFVDPVTGDSKPAPDGWNDKKIAAFAQKMGLEVITRVKQQIRWTVTCDHVVLHDDWSPYDEFTIVPFFPFFRRGRPMGIAELLISPQEQLNKSESQQLHIVNSTANGGWMVEENSLVNMEPDELEKKGSKTGIVVEYRRGTTMPEKIQPNQIPTGLDRLSSRAAQYIQQISGINPAMLGSEKREISGVALDKKIGASERLMDVPMDSLERTRMILGRVATGMIQRFYTDERVYYLTDEDDPASQPEELAINREERGTIVNDITLAKFGMTIATSPSRDTMDEMTFAELVTLREIGVMVPDDEIIMVSNHPRRRELAKRVRLDLGIDRTPEQEEAIALQNELAMMEAQKQLELLDAQIAEKMANAQLAAAKAGVAGAQPDMDLQKLMSDREMRQREIDLRERLAQMSKDAKDHALETSSATKLALSMLQSDDKKRADDVKLRIAQQKERTAPKKAKEK